MTERNYWLVKSEPGDYSFQDLQAEEDQTAEWDGIRSYAGRNTLRSFGYRPTRPSGTVSEATRAGTPCAMTCR